MPEVWFLDRIGALSGVAMATFAQAGRGLVFATLVAFAVFELRRRLAPLDFLYRPFLVFAYSLPAFALSLFASAAGLPAEYDWVLVGVTLIVPMEVAISQGDAEARDLDRGLAGTPWRRYAQIRAPAMTPALLHGLAVALPWALLAAMLLEVAQGSRGLGQQLAGAMILGLRGQLPVIILVACVSAGGFFLLDLLSRLVRVGLGMSSKPSRSAILPPRNLDLGVASLVWGGLVIVGVWWAMHLRYPIMVASPIDPEPLLNLMPKLQVQFLQTLTSTLIGCGVGVSLGCALAIVALGWPAFGKVMEFALLPLQIIPLPVFAPALLVVTLATSIPGVHPPGVGMDWSSILIGVLGAAYISQQYLTAWLTILPGRASGVLAAHPPTSWRVIAYVYLPWLARGVSAFLPALAPRTALAVLVTEYLVTDKGIGGAIARMRGERSFHETFVLVMVLIITVFVIQSIVSLSVKRGVESLSSVTA